METKKSLVFLLIAVLAVAGIWYAAQHKRQGSGPARFAEDQLRANAIRSNVQFTAYPDDFPKDLQLVSGPFDQALRTKSASGGEVINVALKVPNSADNVADLYKTQLEAKGWTVFVERISQTERLVKAGKAAQRADILATGPANELLSSVEILFYK